MIIRRTKAVIEAENDELHHLVRMQRRAIECFEHAIMESTKVIQMQKEIIAALQGKTIERSAERIH